MNKVRVFDLLYEDGDVLVTINTSVEGVSAPPNLADQETVSFVLGAVPTPNMEVSEWGIVASMRFTGNLFSCKIPWESVVQMSSENAVVQFRNAGEPEKSKPDPDTQSEPKQKKGRSHLRLIK